MGLTSSRKNMKTLKQRLQKAFKSLGIYERLKSSWLYDAYWGIADRRVIRERDHEVKFYRKVLNGFGKGDLIFDIGANHGQKVDVFLRLGARVVAVEPDEFNQGVLKRKYLAWRFSPKPVTIVGKAVSDHAVSQTMWIDAPGSAKNTLSSKWVETLRTNEQRFGERLDFAQTKKVEATTLEELILNHGEPFFVKIDVEGYEPNVVRGLKRAVKYLSFEVNLPEFRDEGLQCIESLSRLCPEGSFNFIADSEPDLGLGAWLDSRDFIPVFEQCKHDSIEVFWKTPVGSNIGNKARC